jgi:hypothetical protein
MSEFLWRIVAFIVSRKTVADWLIRRAERTPYLHIHSKQDGSLYMGRWWLFNPYPREDENQAQAWRKSWRGKLPSARIHHICRPDMERDEHSHPWDARTFVLRNWYHEVRGNRFFIRKAGDTATLRYGEFHRITTVPEGGVWTLFITWPKQGSWGFKVGEKVVPWRKYLNEV